jgi:hypothetical protein
MKQTQKTLLMILIPLILVLVFSQLASAGRYSTAQLNVNTSDVNAGSVSSTGGNYDYGSTVTVTAVENQGFSFLYWRMDGTFLSELHTVTVMMNDDHDLLAVFSSLQNAPTFPIQTEQHAPSPVDYALLEGVTTIVVAVVLVLIFTFIYVNKRAHKN